MSGRSLEQGPEVAPGSSDSGPAANYHRGLEESMEARRRLILTASAVGSSVGQEPKEDIVSDAVDRLMGFHD